jgi:cobalt-zinc-cadmium resistance protein CzcA
VIAGLARFSVLHSRSVVVVTLACALLALIPALSLRLDALPDLTNNQVIVLTGAPGLSPEEVELSVTRPVEIALSGLSLVREQRSLSRYGISSVTVVFEDRLDPWRARQMVSERIAGLALPPQAQAPELAPLTGGLGEIFHLTLSSSRRSLAELYELATLRAVPLLKSVPGVVEVNSWGGARRSLEVVVDPLALANRKLTLREVRDALREASGASAGGALRAQGGQVLLRGVARPLTALDLGSSIVRPPAVRAADLGSVAEGTLLRLGAASENGRGETVYLMVQMLRDENALEVVRRIHRQMQTLRAALPRDVRVDVVYDRSVLVGGTLKTVALNLLEGGALVIGVLLLFLGSWRAGLLAASVIPLAMIFATALMSLFDLPGNLMSLGALDFGLLVDGAIVLVEGAFHQARSARGARSWREHVREVADHSARPVFFSVIVILLVYVPVLSMTGTDGKLFRPMALTVVLALSAALVLSLTWVPAVLSLVLGFRDVPAREPWLVRGVERVYRVVLRGLLPRPLLVSLFALALLALGVLVARTRGVEFTPQLDEGDLVIQTTRKPDISLEQSVQAAQRLERLLRASIPEVTSVVSRIGSPAVATDIMGFEQADVFVKLVPRAAYRAGLTREALVGEMAALIEEREPGGEPSFTQPIQMRFNELLGGAVTDVAVSVYGDDLLTLRRLADALARAFRDVRGAHDVRVLAPASVPLTTVKPRPLALAQVGLRAHDVLETVQALNVGLDVGETRDGPLRIPLRLRLLASARAAEIAELPVAVPDGGSIALGRVAEIEESRAPGLVNRRNGQRRLVVGFNVRGADLGSTVAAAQHAARAAVPLPTGYRLSWGGQYESLQEARARLSWIVPGVLVLVLGLLTATFAALRPALLVFLVVPIAVVGGVLALALSGMSISLPAAVGFIALSGIAVMNGVVWMARAQELAAASDDPRTVAHHAALDRVRPVLMTALVAALGFVPMMLSQGVGAEVQRPLATVVVGGLFTSTLLTLIVLPAIYPWFHAKRRARQGSEELPRA